MKDSKPVGSLRTLLLSGGVACSLLLALQSGHSNAAASTARGFGGMRQASLPATANASPTPTVVDQRALRGFAASAEPTNPPGTSFSGFWRTGNNHGHGFYTSGAPVADIYWTMTRSADPRFTPGPSLDGGTNASWAKVDAPVQWLTGTWGNPALSVAKGSYAYEVHFDSSAIAQPISANILVQIAADDSLAQIFLNGIYDVTPAGAKTVNYRNLTILNIPLPVEHLQKNNTLTFVIRNTGGPSGFVLSRISGAYIPAPIATATPKPLATQTPIAGVDSVPVSVRIQGTVRSAVIPNSFLGLSYEKTFLSQGNFNAKNTNLIALFRRLGPGVLRIGGALVEKDYWNALGSGIIANHTTPDDIAGLQGFLNATGWKVIYGVNLCRSTPAMAVSETQAAQKALQSNLLGIEIGNEPNTYFDKGCRPENYGNSDFQKDWHSFATAIRASSPNVALVGPSTTPVALDWTLTFGAGEPNLVSIISQHYYRASATSPSATIPKMLSNDTALASELSKLKQVYGASLPYRYAETNSYSIGGAPNVSNVYASALWAVDELASLALGGASGANFHTVNDKVNGYTPIAFQNGTGIVSQVMPEYYGISLFQQAFVGGMLLADSVSTNGLLLSTYAVQRSDKGRNIIILNKDEKRAATVTVTLDTAIASYKTLTMSGPSLSALSGVTIGGSSIGIDGSYAPTFSKAVHVNGTTFTVMVKPVTAVVIESQK